jgi:hypothetical protein
MLETGETDDGEHLCGGKQEWDAHCGTILIISRRIIK